MKRACGERPHGAARLLALALACAAVALPTTAQAATGGASTEARVAEGIVFTPMQTAGATWYGPGLYGNRTACGQILRPETVGVAHRSLPCGTAVKFSYRGREIVTRVIDRGPFSVGHTWDLTNGARRALGFDGSNRVLYALALSYTRHDRR